MVAPLRCFVKPCRNVSQPAQDSPLEHPFPPCYAMGMERIRILVAEDYAMVREGTCRLLGKHADFEIVGQARDGQEALELALKLQPDIVIADVRMPRLNGIQLLSSLKKQLPGIKALMLSAYSDEDYILACLKEGASGYLLKTIDLEKLTQAIRTVHSGQVVFDPVVAAKMAGILAREPSIAKAELLSSKEYDVLRLVSRGMRNNQIADELGLSMSTVAKHVNKILEKLGVSSRSEAVRYALAKLIID